MIEAVIPCSHGKAEPHQVRSPVVQLDAGTWGNYGGGEFRDCPGGRRVRLVEVQQKQKWFCQFFNMLGDQGEMCHKGHPNDTHDPYRFGCGWVTLDAAVPGPTYRLEEVDV